MHEFKKEFLFEREMKDLHVYKLFKSFKTT